MTATHIKHSNGHRLPLQKLAVNSNHLMPLWQVCLGVFSTSHNNVQQVVSQTLEHTYSSANCAFCLKNNHNQSQFCHGSYHYSIWSGETKPAISSYSHILDMIWTCCHGDSALLLASFMAPCNSALCIILLIIIHDETWCSSFCPWPYAAVLVSMLLAKRMATSTTNSVLHNKLIVEKSSWSDLNHLVLFLGFEGLALGFMLELAGKPGRGFLLVSISGLTQSNHNPVFVSFHSNGFFIIPSSVQRACRTWLAVNLFGD